MADIITINGMQFEKTKLIPNYRGEYDTNPCDECHLNIHWVDYGGECKCGKIACAGFDRAEEPYVWTIVGGVDKLKSKE